LVSVATLAGCQFAFGGQIDNTQLPVEEENPPVGRLIVYNDSAATTITTVTINGDSKELDAPIAIGATHEFVLSPGDYAIEAANGLSLARYDLSELEDGETRTIKANLETHLVVPAVGKLRVINDSGLDITQILVAWNNGKVRIALPGSAILYGGAPYDITEISPGTYDIIAIRGGKEWETLGFEIHVWEEGDDPDELVVTRQEPGVDVTPPADVTYLTAVVQADKVRLSWTNPVDEDGDFDHIEISYSTGSATTQELAPLESTELSTMVNSLSYGRTYAFVVRTVDESGNKSLGAVVIATLDTVIDDFDLDRYVTAPMAGAAPNAQTINTVQYRGAISWRKANNDPFTGSVFEANTVYGAWVTLTANPGYTFQGVAQNSFTHTGVTDIGNQVNNGRVTIVFQKAVQGWYVSHLVGNDSNDGSAPGASLKTVAKAVELIRTAYANAGTPWPGKEEGTPANAVIIVSGTVPFTEQIRISNTVNSITGNSGTPLPPIALRGAGADNIGIIEGPAGKRMLFITDGAHVIMENDLVLRGHVTGIPSGDQSGNGGGVFIAGNSTFTMSGGTITGASAPDGYGGAVYASQTATFNMKGGTITGNKAGRGAGVCIWNGAFTMSGGSIEDNEASVLGGGVYVVGGAVSTAFTMSGGTITGNKAVGGGGVSIEQAHAVCTMDGGTIAGNQATQYGGAIQVFYAAKVIINNGVVSNNTTSNSGGGISISHDLTSVIMNGGTILGNTASQAGGGVYVNTGYSGVPTFTMQGGTIAENQAGTYGGGVYIMDGGVFNKQPVSPAATSGVIYGYDALNPSSNKVQGTLIIEVEHGHAVYVSASKRRETTVLPEQHLDSTATGGWTE
jgi:hypothetical protein